MLELEKLLHIYFFFVLWQKQTKNKKFRISWDIMGYHVISWDVMGYHGISCDFLGLSSPFVIFQLFGKDFSFPIFWWLSSPNCLRFLS